MRGVVLAGGSGSRLLPLTRVTNKHLLPVGKEPMIFHPIRKLAAAGITEVLVVTGVEHMGHIVGTLRSGRDLGVDITYRVQEEAGGIAEALLLAESWCVTTPMVVLLGDNIFEDPLAPLIEEFDSCPHIGCVVLKDVPDPERFGVAQFGPDGSLIGLVEKPMEPPSNSIATGIYMYQHGIFEVLHSLVPSGRGELEITEANDILVRRGDLHAVRLEGWWSDAGTHSTLHEANRLLEGTPCDF
jgi:glucose-1-phosphate thymidylyltransferase